MKDFKRKYGPWALVTGASSGIGEEFAKQLGKAGLNLILVARRKNKLDQIKNRLENRSHIQVKTVGVDLVQDGFLDDIRKITDNLEIGLLVNNAGIWEMGEYLKIKIEDEIKMMNLNIKAPAILTHHYVPKMVERKKGGIINVASLLAYLGVPFSAAYAATKAYELVKGEGLWYELKKKGIDVLSLNPGITKTEMTTGFDFSHIPFSSMQPAIVAEAALRALGKRSQVIPGKFNKLLGILSKRVMTRNMNTNMFGILMGKANAKMVKY